MVPSSNGAEFVLPSADYTAAGMRLRSSRFPTGIADASRSVICVPGYGAAGESFARLRPLAGAYDLHLLTLPEEAMRSADPLRRFGALIEAFTRRFDRPVLLGTSFGGAIAIEAAATLGRTIGGLILISSFAVSPHGGLRVLTPLLPLLEWIAGHTQRLGVRWVGGSHLDRAAALELLRETNSISPAERHARLLAVLHCDVTREASRIEVPVLILHGTADHVVPPDAAHKLATLIGHAELHEIGSAGHVPYLTHAAEMNALIAEFLPRCFEARRMRAAS